MKCKHLGLTCGFIYLFLSLTLAVSQNTGRCQDPLVFADERLARSIEVALEKVGEELSCADMLDLETLSADGQGITSLAGLEWAKNLRLLSLRDNEITDLQPLRKLRNLQELYLTGNRIEVLTPFLHLTNLQILHLDNNEIQRLGALYQLSRLQVLELSNNSVKDLTPLADLALAEGTTLSLAGNCLDLAAIEQTSVLDELRSRQIALTYEPQRDCSGIHVLPSSAEITVCDAARNAVERWVVQGEEGWLFSELDLSTPASLEQVIPYLTRFVAALETHGITLVAVIPPRRGMVYDNKFRLEEKKFATYSALGAREAYGRLVGTLNEVGIVTPNLLSVMLEQRDESMLFFKTDHHWTPAGAKLVAEGVAAALESLPTYTALGKTDFQTLAEDVPVPFEGGWNKEVEKACSLQLANEQVTAYYTSSQDVQGGEGLFAEVPEPEVVLVGTSYSQPERAPGYNFEGFLREALSLDVLNLAVTGGGPATALKDYFLSDEFQTYQPTFLIWEFLSPYGNNILLNPVTYRQLIPSVYGDCGPEGSLLQQEAEMNGSATVLTNGANLPLFGSEYALVFEVSNQNLGEFQVILRHENGEEDRLPLEASTRAENRGKFFVELSSITSPLEEVRLEARAGVVSKVTTRVCKNEQ
jgi:alginate biosynthesis protein AlgX